MKFIQNHKIFTFYSATFCLTGFLFFIQTMIFPHVALPLYLLSPAIITLVMIIITNKKQGVISFIGGLIPTKMNIVWLALSIILPIIIILVGAVVFHLSNGTGINLSIKSLGLGFVIVVVIGAFGEELGWRAYLLPLLLKKYHNKVFASIILGILWGLWHVGDYGEGLGFLLFVFSTIGMSIIMTWLYYQGKKNFLTSVLFHTFYNLSGAFLTILPENGVPNIQFRLISAIIPCGIAVIIVFASPIFIRKGIKHAIDE